MMPTAECQRKLFGRKGRIGSEHYSVRPSIARPFTLSEPPRAFRGHEEIITSQRESKRRWVGRLDRQSVAGHGAVCRTKSGCECCAFVTDPFYPRDGSVIIKVNIFMPITTGSDIIKRTSVFESKWSCHGGNLTHLMVEY
jgi:hypothetical protein